MTLSVSLLILEESNAFSNFLRKHLFATPIISIIAFAFYIGFASIDWLVDLTNVLNSSILILFMENVLHAIIAIDVAATFGMNFIALCGVTFSIYIIVIYNFIKQKLINYELSTEETTSVDSQKKGFVKSLFITFADLRI